MANDVAEYLAILTAVIFNAQIVVGLAPWRCGGSGASAARAGCALLQVDRVSAAHGLPASEVNDLVVAHIQWRTLGCIGEERVNVLELSLAVAALSTDPTGSMPGAEG